MHDRVRNPTDQEADDLEALTVAILKGMQRICTERPQIRENLVITAITHVLGLSFQHVGFDQDESLEFIETYFDRLFSKPATELLN